jgi:hypothetical protein
VTVLEFRGFGAQLGVRERRHAGFQFVDAAHFAQQAPHQSAVTAAEDLTEDTDHHKK